MFSEISLAYWITVEGYLNLYDRTKTLLFFTYYFYYRRIYNPSFSTSKLNIKSTLKVRDKVNNKYRIIIFKLVRIELFS